jgi:hypothetical protein
MQGTFIMHKRYYKKLAIELAEAAELTGKNYLRPCKLRKSGEFLKKRK